MNFAFMSAGDLSVIKHELGVDSKQLASLCGVRTATVDIWLDQKDCIPMRMAAFLTQSLIEAGINIPERLAQITTQSEISNLDYCIVKTRRLFIERGIPYANPMTVATWFATVKANSGVYDGRRIPEGVIVDSTGKILAETRKNDKFHPYDFILWWLVSGDVEHCNKHASCIGVDSMVDRISGPHHIKVAELGFGFNRPLTIEDLWVCDDRPIVSALFENTTVQIFTRSAYVLKEENNPFDKTTTFSVVPKFVGFDTGEPYLIHEGNPVKIDVKSREDLLMEMSNIFGGNWVSESPHSLVSDLRI